MNQICHASRNANALALIWGAHQQANDHVVLDVSLSPIHTSVISKSMFVMQSSPHPFQENWHMIVSCFTHPYQTTLGMLMLLFCSCSLIAILLIGRRKLTFSIYMSQPI